MEAFYDSSALVKLFTEESGSKVISSYIDDEKNTVWILDLLRVELQSAVLRKFRNGEISRAMLIGVQEGINQQLQQFNEVFMSGDIVHKATELISRFGEWKGLRTLDALHVAGWMLYAEDEWKFVTSDKIQREVVVELGGEVIFIE